MEEADQAGALKSARKTRGGHQASTTQIRSRISDFVRRIEATNDKSAEVRSEALAYLKSLENGRKSIISANIAVIDVIRIYKPELEESENVHVQLCLDEIDSDVAVLLHIVEMCTAALSDAQRRMIDICTSSPSAGASGEAAVLRGWTDDAPGRHRPDQQHADGRLSR